MSIPLHKSASNSLNLQNGLQKAIKCLPSQKLLIRSGSCPFHPFRHLDAHERTWGGCLYEAISRGAFVHRSREYVSPPAK